MWPNPQETEDLVTFTEEILIENFFVQWTFRSGLIVTEGRENAENME